MDNVPVSLPGQEPLELKTPELETATAAARRGFWLLDRAVDLILGLGLAAELLLVLAGVISRAVFDVGLLWVDEISKIALSVIAFVGGAAAYRERQHTILQVALEVLPPRARGYILASAEWTVILVAGTVGFVTVPLIQARSYEVSPVLGLSGIWNGVPLAAGLALIVLYALGRLAIQPARLPVLTTGAGAMVLGLVTAVGHSVWAPWISADDALPLGLGLFLLSVLLAIPVGFALLIGCIVYLSVSGAAFLVAVPQNMLDGIGYFVLLALPFFILAGLIMERGGISLRLVRFVLAAVGHVRGGLLHVMVVSMYLVSGLSGSKIADVAAVGAVTRSMLEREGYSREEGASVLSVSAAMGETIPPSLPMLLLGSITTVSIGALFVGGLVPAAAVALCIMALIWLRARRSGQHAKTRFSWPALRASAVGAILPLLLPILLFAGILSGAATPTEVSSFAVVYGLLLAVILYRELRLAAVWALLVDAAILSGMVLFIVAAASAFSWTLTVAMLPQQLVGLVDLLHDSRPLFLLATIALMIVAGAMLEGLPALLILAPLLMPIAVRIGIDPIHYAMVLLIAMGTGAFMPPVGIGFYIACAICRSSVEASARAMLPYLGVLLLGLLLVAFVPWLTLAVPDLVLPR
jgi:tripartite ATP-independent transporter DctM subunit